jgi:hypothetical protein
MLASANNNISPNSDSLCDYEKNSIATPNTHSKYDGENDEVGEEKLTPFVEMEKDFKDTGEGYTKLPGIFGNKVSRDGSNRSNIPPVLIILAIASLLTIFMVCFIKKK